VTLVIEVMQDLHRIVEMRDGVVFRTAYVKSVWVSQDNVTPPTGYVYVTPRNTLGAIRTVRKVS
jgi:hypothetical protein